MLTHYYAAIVAGCLFFYVFLRRKTYGVPALWLTARLAAVLALYTLWLASGVVSQALHSEKTIVSDLSQWFRVSWRTIFGTMNAFNNGKWAGLVDSSPRWTFVVGGLLFTAPALFSLRRLVASRDERLEDLAHRDSLALLGVLWVLPLLLVIAAGKLGIQYDARYVAFAIGPYYVLVARGLSELTGPVIRWSAVVCVLAYSTLALRANYFVPYKENYRDALAYVAQEYREGDCCLFLPFQSLPAQWSIYQGHRPAPKTITLPELANGKATCDRTWLILYRRAAIERGNEGKKQLEVTHTRVRANRYFWVDVEPYVPKKN